MFKKTHSMLCSVRIYPLIERKNGCESAKKQHPPCIRPLPISNKSPRKNRGDAANAFCTRLTPVISFLVMQPVFYFKCARYSVAKRKSAFGAT